MGIERVRILKQQWYSATAESPFLYSSAPITTATATTTTTPNENIAAFAVKMYCSIRLPKPKVCLESSST